MVLGCSALGARSLSMGWLDCWSILPYKLTLVFLSSVFSNICLHIERYVHTCLWKCVYKYVHASVCKNILMSSYLVFLLLVVLVVTSSVISPNPPQLFSWTLVFLLPDVACLNASYQNPSALGSSHFTKQFLLENLKT